jgi:hypothetical protein
VRDDLVLEALVDQGLPEVPPVCSATWSSAGRDPEPSAGVIDSQSVKADAVVDADSRGCDGVRGR